jgi:hypothetical protein
LGFSSDSPQWEKGAFWRNKGEKYDEAGKDEENVSAHENDTHEINYFIVEI